VSSPVSVGQLEDCSTEMGWMWMVWMCCAHMLLDISLTNQLADKMTRLRQRQQVHSSGELSANVPSANWFVIEASSYFAHHGTVFVVSNNAT